QLVLKWVSRNIEAFGGDRDRVTIFGESAGGQNVYSQLASPLAAGRFRGAIAESGAYFNFQDYYPFIVTLATAETTGTLLVPSGNATASALGCSKATLPETASCLRGLPASTLVSAQPSTLFPFVDGTLLTQTPGAAFALGQFNRVPVISGGNHDEWRLFVFFDFNFLGIPLATEADYEAAVNATFIGFGSTFGYDYIYGPWGLYPLVNYPITPPIPGDPSPSPGIALGASGTDAFFACPELNVVKLLSRYVTTYSYEFNDENAPPAQSSWGASLNFPMGAYHTAELQYLFTGDFFGYPIGPLSHKQEQLSDAMLSYWTRFATTGDPNSSGEPVWSPYNASTNKFQSLIPPTPVVETTFDSDHICSVFWSAL
ncbi:MAG: carboxylesterase family protein, partial [Candidatus Binataceae bacterium]